VPAAAAVRTEVAQLRATGAAVALDDFGAGYSSLSRLRQLDFDVLKIDGSLLVGVPADAAATEIFCAALELAGACRVSVVAEGVEDRATWEILRRAHCDIVQGFFLSRPISAAEVTVWLSDFQSGVQPVLHALREAA